MRRIKIAVFSMLSILSFAALNSIKASAAAFGNIGGQSGIQTRDMTIDEGLKILGYNPSDFKIKQNIKVDEKTDLSPYYGRWDKREDNYCPIEVIGLTEGYDYLEDGYIDTYIYMYTPYQLSYNTNDNIMNGTTSMSLKMDVNEEYENIDSTYYYVNLHGAGKFDNDIQKYEELRRAYVYTSQEAGSVSSGVTRILLRIYNASDITKERKYRVEKVLYNYFNPATGESEEGTTTPHINFKYKDKQVISSMDEDTDSSAFVVKNKSIVCVEAYAVPYHWSGGFNWVKKTNVFITLRDKQTGEYIDNATSIQAVFKIKGDSEYREPKCNVDKSSAFMKFGNIKSKDGQLQYASKSTKWIFKKKIMPKMKEPYPYDEEPTYEWSWNYYVEDFKVVYIWHMVEKGTVVQGSCYENGLHVEYDDNGKPLGVYDKDGNKYSNIKYDDAGVLLNDDDSIRMPEYSHKSLDVIYGEDNNFIDKAKDMINKIKNQLKDKLTSDKNKYFIIGGIALATVGVAVIIIKKSKKEE